MKLGIVLPQHDSGRDHILAAARLAEEAGLDSIWAYDNLRPKRGFSQVMECWTTLSFAAAVTERITLGPLVVRATLRHPRLATHMARTLAELAPGRVVVGLGTGDRSTRREMIEDGYPWTDLDERVRMLKDQLDDLRVQAPDLPLWIGGTDRRLLALLPQADGWSYWGPVNEFAPVLGLAVKAAGEHKIEICWGGRTIGEPGLRELATLGVDHAVVAVGVATYARRIQWLGSLKDALS